MSEEKKGFGGFGDMVSDISSDISSNSVGKTDSATREVPSSDQKGNTSPARKSQPEPSTRKPPVVLSPDQSGWKWLAGIVAVIAVIWIASGSGGKNQAPRPYTPAASTPPSTSYSTPAVAAPVDKLSEETPPGGSSNVLTAPQIRYCLAEDIRIESSKAAINNYLDSDVNRFNGMVSDYNNRCGHFRYRKGTLESARSEVERYRADLQLEGRRRFSTGSSTSPKPTPQVVKPTPDETVKSIQQRLNMLGYDAGTADGFIGTKTRAAISSFQRSIGIPDDGTASESVLRKLQKTEKPKINVPTPTQPTLQPKFVPVLPQPSVSIPVQSQAASSGENSVRSDTPQPNSFEQDSIERACDGAKKYSGPGAYSDCLKRELASLRSSGGRPDISRANPSEQEAIERTCDGPRKYSGPGTYYDCLKRELRNLQTAGGRPDLSLVSSGERDAIERTCDGPRKYSGPAAYYDCLNREIKSLRSTGSRPDLSGASSSEQDAIERACDGPRKYSGPAAYYDCLKREVASLRSSGGRPDLSRANSTEQASIERACDGPRKYSGPGAYYDCLRRELNRIGYR